MTHTRTYVVLTLLGFVVAVGAALLTRPDVVKLHPVAVPLPSPLAPAGPDAPPAPPAAPKWELIVVSASWCGPCRQLHAELDKNGQALADAGIAVEVLTDDKTAERTWKVREYPTIILLRDGKESARRSGYATAAELAAWAVTHQ